MHTIERLTVRTSMRILLDMDKTIWLMTEDDGECFRVATAAEIAAAKASKNGLITVSHPRRGELLACLAERWIDENGNDVAAAL